MFGRIALSLGSVMPRFIDWMFSHIFLPQKRKWAEERVKELLIERKEVYERLMDEIHHMEDEVRKNGNR